MSNMSTTQQETTSFGRTESETSFGRTESETLELMIQLSKSIQIIEGLKKDIFEMKSDKCEEHEVAHRIGVLKLDVLPVDLEQRDVEAQRARDNVSLEAELVIND